MQAKHTDKITPPQQEHWPVPDAAAAHAAVRALSGRFTVRALPPVKRRYTFYDSFPWNLWFAGKVLYRVGDELVLAGLTDCGFDGELARAEFKQPTPRFCWQFPESLRPLLRPLLKLRAVLPCAGYMATTTIHELKNADAKTVARLVINEFSRPVRGGEVFLCLLRSEALRGYETEFEHLNTALLDQGLARRAVNPLRVWFDVTHAEPQRFSAKPKLALAPRLPAREVVCDYLTSSLALARRCEAGIIDDIDSEFLHDFRVCFRSMRSVLAQVRGALPPATSENLKRAFADLGKRSNRLRDLDVYLLEEPRYKCMVPDYLTADLDSLFAHLRAQRREALRKLRRYLRSKAYAQRLEHIGELVTTARDQAIEDWDDAGREAIIDVARRRLRTQFRKVRRTGRALRHDSEDEAVHALRIQCKKLRYSLELFAPLCDPKRLRELLRVMKKLQTTLGKFNDSCVQQAFLLEYRADTEQDGAMMYLAIGALLANLHREQCATRKRIADLFEHFDTQATRRLVKHLLPDDEAKP